MSILQVRSVNKTKIHLMKKPFLLYLFLFCGCLYGQDFISMSYQFSDTTVTYGSAQNCFGTVDTLDMDISVPVGDTPPTNGRPLMVLIHGGAFMAGSKSDGGIVRLREEFAKRGYVTAAINYRLGIIQTDEGVNCNTWFFNLPWNCLNATDTTEWTRAGYRGMQDARGSIRYLMNHAGDYNIDPQNIFVVGESAGAFIALQVGYLDDNTEVPFGVGPFPVAPAPGQYMSSCHPVTMNLARPNLGSPTGTLNPSTISYRIRGVGEFYGAMQDNLFSVNPADTATPALYLYHQPDDLVVPFDRDRIYAGYAYYATLWPLNCVWMRNRPFVSGGNHIKDMIDALALSSASVPDYFADFTTSNVPWPQANSTGGHQIADFPLRTGNMATFFAPKIDTTTVGMEDMIVRPAIKIYPNPTSGEFRVIVPKGYAVQSLRIADLTGRVIHNAGIHGNASEFVLSPEISTGVYLLLVETDQGIYAHKIVVE
jgi:hypothetical protein